MFSKLNNWYTFFFKSRCERATGAQAHHCNLIQARIQASHDFDHLCFSAANIKGINHVHHTNSGTRFWPADVFGRPPLILGLRMNWLSGKHGLKSVRSNTAAVAHHVDTARQKLTDSAQPRLKLKSRNLRSIDETRNARQV